jgi:oxygen-dependent protoporphyrinogen oxidase
MPQYHVGHRARLDRIERLATRLPGLLLAGSAYRGVGVPDCITQGWAAADRVLGVSRAAV